ncbi:hypothetical protein ACWEIK_17805 [Streptomyces sp. NPDC004673]
MTHINTAAQTEPDEPGKPPLRQRITARWDNLQPATKTVVVTALTAAATGLLRALVDSRTPAAAPTPQSEVAGETQTGRYDHLGRHVYLHNHGQHMSDTIQAVASLLSHQQTATRTDCQAP